MKPRVGVIDYGMGNLHSVSKAIALQGGDVLVTDRVNRLRNRDLLVLPGVGSFGAAAKTLKKKGLDRFVRSWIKEEKPYLGICLGYQLLFDSSEEDPGVPGLGVLPGKVVRFRLNGDGKRRLKVPHMGWNTAERVKTAKGNVFSGIKGKDYFYYVHTFYPVPKRKADVFTKTSYGVSFCSSVKRKNLFASQFHPEKSGDVGMRLIRNILKGVKR